ncbi:MAG: hypothetical protein AAF436_13730 [Myxococcota bacterium]
MGELTTVAAVFAVLVGLAYAIAFVGQPDAYQLAWFTMTAIGLIAVVAEAVYFAGLFVALKKNDNVPPRWYARSFEHHSLLTPVQRRVVLPFFYLGGLGLAVALLIAIVLVFASFGLFRELRAS